MRRGEVWSINLDPTIGSEIRKTRPALVMSVDAAGALPLRVVAPFTSWKDHFVSAPWLVRIVPDTRNGLVRDSAADTIQIRSVSERRFAERLGELSEQDLTRVEEGVRIVLGM